jgi:hypothetical protein
MKIDQVERFLTVFEMPRCFKKAYHDVKMFTFFIGCFSEMNKYFYSFNIFDQFFQLVISPLSLSKKDQVY